MPAIQNHAVKYLLNIPELVDAVGKTSKGTPFIFRDEMLTNLDYNQYNAVSAVVVEDGGPIATAGLTRFRNRRLTVNIWANGNRSAIGSLIDPRSVEDKIFYTFDIIDKYLHRTDTASVVWEGLTTYACERIGDISKPVAISDGNGIKTATVNYAVLI